MNEDLSASFADLLDPDYQNHVITAMKGWCDNYRYASGEAYANLVLTDIARPLRWWLNETKQKRKPVNYQDIEAGIAFADKADAIVFILLHKTRPLYPEHVTIFDNSWSAFRNSIAANLFIEAKILSDYIRGLPDLETIANEELRKRRELDEQEREARKQANLEKWHWAGMEAARKYDADDVKIWVEAAKKILRLNERKIKSIRVLAQGIIKETGCDSVAFETIRKEEEIIKIYKEHSLKNNFG